MRWKECVLHQIPYFTICDQSMFKFLIHSLRCNVFWTSYSCNYRMKISACSVHTAMVINICTERIDHAYGCTDIMS